MQHYGICFSLSVSEICAKIEHWLRCCTRSPNVK